MAFICKSTYTINARFTNSQLTLELHFLYCMTFKVKNIVERDDNKVQLGKVFYDANLGKIKTIVSVKKKIVS